MSLASISLQDPVKSIKSKSEMLLINGDPPAVAAPAKQNQDLTEDQIVKYLMNQYERDEDPTIKNQMDAIAKFIFRAAVAKGEEIQEAKSQKVAGRSNKKMVSKSFKNIPIFCLEKQTIEKASFKTHHGKVSARVKKEKMIEEDYDERDKTLYKMEAHHHFGRGQTCSFCDTKEGSQVLRGPLY